MWWLTNTAWASRRVRLTAIPCLTATILATAALAQELHPPAEVVAGSSLSMPTSGKGKAGFYLIGPGVSIKREIQLGQDLQIRSEDLRAAGKYLALICTDSCRTSTFFVVPAPASTISFLVHPSRAPVGQRDAISGVAFPLDNFRNLVLAPLTVNFKLTAGGTPVISNAVPSQHGVAWFRTSPGNRAGTGEVVASINDVSARRVVQLVASDPCNLRIKAQRYRNGILVETDPVRDCAGNPVPDGTIVTFTASSAGRKSTVDAPIKQGIARAQMMSPGEATISVASGVVLGNEVHVGGLP